MKKAGVMIALAILMGWSSIAGAEEPAPVKIRVPSGIYQVGDEEVYFDSFLISQSAFRSADSVACDLPTVNEYLVAARNPEFLASKYFEQVMTPAQDACTWSKEVLEAEGVAGNIYFAGLGSHVPQDGFRFVRGGKDPRETISSIDNNIYSFWGEGFKPSPRGYRCVERETVDHPRAFVKAITANVLVRRSDGARVKMVLTEGAGVKILFERAGWSFVEAQGHHRCQEDREWDVFEDRGWLKSGLIGRQETLMTPKGP